MKNYIYPLIFLFVCFNSYGQASSVDKLQKKLSTYFPSSPDSAIAVLHQLSKFENQLSDSLSAGIYNKLGISHGQIENRDSSNYYFRRAIKTAGHSMQKGNIYYNWALAERNFGNYDKTLALLEKADTIYKAHQNKYGMGMVYVEEATVWNYKGRSTEAVQSLKKAIALLASTHDKKGLVTAKQELANAYLTSSSYTFAKELYQDILPSLKEKGGLNYYFTLVNYSDCLFHLEELDNAQKKLEIAYKFFKANSYDKFIYYVLSKLAKINREKGALETAAAQFKTAFYGMAAKNSPRLKYVGAFYIELLNTLKQPTEALKVLRLLQKKDNTHKIDLNYKNDLYFLDLSRETLKANELYEEALGASERIGFLKDSINKSKEMLADKKIEAKYRNKYQHEKNKLLESKNQLLVQNARRKQLLIIGLVVICVLLGLVGTLVYRKNKQKIALQQETLKETQQKKMALEQKRVAEQKLLEERQNQLAQKNRELVSVSLEMADTHNQLTDILEQAPANGFSKKTKNQFKRTLKKKGYWDFFIKKFVEVHPGFRDELRKEFPNFTEKDIDFCVLLKLKMHNKEIAQLLSISHESVISKKYRLTKKLDTLGKKEIFEKMIA